MPRKTAQLRNDADGTVKAKRITVVLDNAELPQPLGRTVRRRWNGWDLVVKGTWTSFPCYTGRCAFYFSRSLDGLYYGLRRGRGGPILAVAVVEGTPSCEEIAAAMMRAVSKSGGPFIESPWY